MSSQVAGILTYTCPHCRAVARRPRGSLGRLGALSGLRTAFFRQSPRGCRIAASSLRSPPIMMALRPATANRAIRRSRGLRRSDRQDVSHQSGAGDLHDRVCSLSLLDAARLSRLQSRAMAIFGFLTIGFFLLLLRTPRKRRSGRALGPPQLEATPTTMRIESNS